MPLTSQDQAQAQPFDYRPVGAAAGAALPGASLAQYYLHDLPTYRRMIERAKEIDTSHGNPEKIIQELLKRVKPGDVGIAGLQPSDDAITRFLVNASAATAGGPGAHGQIYGAPMVDELNRPMTFLRNPETGALYEASAGDHYGGGQTRVMHDRAAKLEIAQRNARARVEEQVKALTGQNAPEDPKAFKKFVTQLARKSKDKSFRGAYNELARANNAARAHSFDMADFGARAVSKGFTERATIPTVHHGGWSPATHSIISEAVKSAPKGTVSQGLRDVVREYGPEATSVMGPTMRPVGVAVDAGDALRKAISETAKGNFRGALSHIRELPQAARDAYLHDVEKTDIIQRARGSEKWQQKAHNLMDDVAEGLFKKNDRPLLVMRPQLPKGVTREQYSQALGQMLPHSQGPYAFASANAAGARSVLFPRINFGGLFGGGKAQPGYFEMAKKIGPEKAMAQACAGPNAHHCGSLPAEALRRLGMRASNIASRLYLPNYLALEKGMQPVAVVGKSKMLSDLARMSKYRGAFGLGAMGLMGALGYGATGAAQNALRGATQLQPPKPALDMNMLNASLKTLRGGK